MRPILNRMVQYMRARLDASFAALSDATRRGVLEQLGRVDASITELAERFEAEATKAGARVFRTSDPEEARRYVLRLCRERGVRRIAKSKSMATDELHLNAYLEREGIAVAETDLGEWIVQLAKQRPSHMVMPAIHMSKEQVAELFSKEVKETLPPDISGLVAVARRELREKFLGAELGITGANVAVAETGTLVVVTNEGNARLVSTLPPVHVAVVGIEKLVERHKLKAPEGEPLRLEHESFVAAIEGKSPVVVTGEDGRDALGVAVQDPYIDFSEPGNNAGRTDNDADGIRTGVAFEVDVGAADMGARRGKREEQ